jgi:uncharacterized OsmC-like protein
MLRDMPQGQPQAGDRGLDRTHTWGRTYWGGALFCLQADVEIRKRTGNAKGLQDALRAINRAGGTIEAEWPLARALDIGDHATDTRTLTELYGKMTTQPVTVDLTHFWKQLGVHRSSQGITLDDRAPWAAIRASICGSINRKVRNMNELKIRLRQVSTSTSEATLRDHQVLIDRPVDKGGADMGPMGGELFLASIGGCFMSNLLAAIAARKAEISDVRAEVTGTIADSPARFSAVELCVIAEGQNRELLERLVDIADRGCIMMNTLRGKLDVRIRIGVTI